MRIQPYKEAPAWHPKPWIGDGPPTELSRWAETHSFDPAEMGIAIALLRDHGEYYGGGPPDLQGYYRLISLEPDVKGLAKRSRPW